MYIFAVYKVLIYNIYGYGKHKVKFTKYFFISDY